jgi:hypothetical protein
MKKSFSAKQHSSQIINNLSNISQGGSASEQSATQLVKRTIEHIL